MKNKFKNRLNEICKSFILPIMFSEIQELRNDIKQLRYEIDALKPCKYGHCGGCPSCLAKPIHIK